jgi:hypothetical protein
MSQVTQRRAELLSTIAAHAPATDPDRGQAEQDSYTIAEFCQRNRISKPTYHKLQRLGLGPVEMGIGAVVRISREAALAWRAARENPTGEEALAVARDAAAMRARSRSAASKAVASSAHISSKRRGEV